MSYEDIVKRERFLSGHRSDFFTLWFGLPVSLRITKFFLRHDISENTASLLMWLCGMAGATLLALPSWGRTAGLLLLVLHYILDYVDGQLARERATSSVHGAVMDRLSHFSVQMYAYIMLGVGLYRELGTAWAFLPVVVFALWHQFRFLIANLPTLIYCNELEGYHSEESGIIRKNYETTLAGLPQAAPETAPADGTGHEERPGWRDKIRSASTSFDFLVMALALASLLDLALAGAGWDGGVFVATTGLFAAYYLFNTADYAIQYLNTDTIYSRIAEIEEKVRDRS